MVKKVKLSGEEVVGKTLKECGVDYLFYVPGGMTTMLAPIKDAGVNMVICRNEKAACSMADGYSRITKKPSVCYSQHGAATAILASMMYEPMFAHSPVVALTGATPTKDKDRFMYQECYEIPYFKSTCKFNVDVTDVSRLAEYIRTAIQIAVSGCPGPTHVSMHQDMAESISEMPQIYGNKLFFKIPPFRPRAEPDRIAEAAKLMTKANSPVIICGSGVHISGAYDEVRAIAELLAIPVATNYKGKGSFPEDHPFAIGVMGSYGREVTNEIVRESDLVFFVGTQAEPHMTEDLTAPEPGTSKIIHLDIDATVIGRNYKPDVALVGDAKVILQDLLIVLKKLISRPNPKGQRLQKIARKIKEYENVVGRMMDSDAIPIKPQRMIKEISKVLGPRDITVSDTGFMLCWTTRLLKQKGTGITFVPVGGTLGSSFALALGVSFGAEEDQRVLNLIGDGGIAYNLAELDTAKRFNDQHVPFVILVNNNSAFGQCRPYFEGYSKRRKSYFDLVDLSELNYAKIARAFGCYGARVERPGELAEVLKDAFDSGKPAIVDVVTDKKEYAPLGRARMAHAGLSEIDYWRLSY